VTKVANELSSWSSLDVKAAHDGKTQLIKVAQARYFGQVHSND